MKDKKPINVEIGQRIQQNRENAGMTQESFAELVGLGVKHISAIECGAVGVSLSSLKRICGTLSVSADTLLFGSGDVREMDARAAEVQVIADRLARLPANEFKAAKEILDKLLEVFAANS